ncbi:MAG: transporter solute receptor, family [Deltaproteobacteria bacterium]|nr:transporter solute receptor, family [Deltaproteobacteria bacterium]
MKKLSTTVFCVFWLAALTLTGVFLGTPLHAASELVPVYSPPVGGTAYTLGTGIVAVTNKYIPDARLVHEATSGTLDMVKRMMQRDATNKPAFAIFGSPDAWRAYKGEDEYSKKAFSNLRAVVFINASDQYLVVPANSPIKSFADVKGKKIGIGGPGSTVANSAFTFLEYHGVGKKDFKPFYYNYRESVEGIQNGSLDGGFIGGGYPIAIYTELTLQHNVRIVPVDEEAMKKAIKEHPYYYRGVVKAKSYKGLENDTTIYGFTTVLWTLAGVPNDFVYKMLKNLFDHKEDYYAIHKSARDLTKEDAAKGVPLPFHPGAEKYLKEIGAIK